MAITFDPEIVPGPITNLIEGLFKLYKSGGVKPTYPIFLAKIHLFSSVLEEKNQRTVTEYGHKFGSRDRCWAYNIPNRSTFQALQIWKGEAHQPNFLGHNSVVFISFGGKKSENCD